MRPQRDFLNSFIIMPDFLFFISYRRGKAVSFSLTLYLNTYCVIFIVLNLNATTFQRGLNIYIFFALTQEHNYIQVHRYS